jgi:hypothetical protein
LGDPAWLGDPTVYCIISISMMRSLLQLFGLALTEAVCVVQRSRACFPVYHAKTSRIA